MHDSTGACQGGKGENQEAVIQGKFLETVNTYRDAEDSTYDGDGEEGKN